MSKHGTTERDIIELFQNERNFTYKEEKFKIVKIGKPRPSKGECKTDVYILALNENEIEKEFKISIKQHDADFLENKMSLERAIEIFGSDAHQILVKSIDAVKSEFLEDYLVYFKRHKRTKEKCIKIGWKFEFINKHGGARCGEIELTDEQKINIYAGSNLNCDKKNCKVNGEVIPNSGVANYILEVSHTKENLDFYIQKMLPIERFAIKQDIYFACKAINYRAIGNKWDGNRPLSVYIDWKLDDGILKANFITDKPLQMKANQQGVNIQKILKELKINKNNFDDLERFLDKNINYVKDDPVRLF